MEGALFRFADRTGPADERNGPAGRIASSSTSVIAWVVLGMNFMTPATWRATSRPAGGEIGMVAVSPRRL
jgi:hypothetical protein